MFIKVVKSRKKKKMSGSCVTHETDEYKILIEKSGGKISLNLDVDGRKL
jgi:hypothetical protein